MRARERWLAAALLLGIAGPAHAAIYSGRLVGSLLDGVLPGGWHHAEWAGSVPAGVYFVRLEAQANDGSGRHFRASRSVVVAR